MPKLCALTTPKRGSCPRIWTEDGRAERNTGLPGCVQGYGNGTYSIRLQRDGKRWKAAPIVDMAAVEWLLEQLKFRHPRNIKAFYVVPKPSKKRRAS